MSRRTAGVGGLGRWYGAWGIVHVGREMQRRLADRGQTMLLALVREPRS